MPFGPSASKNSVTLESFCGLITAADPHDLPEGASPRNQDVDYLIGNVHTRAGLVSAFNYSGGNVTNTAGAGVSQSPADIPWTNPGAVTGTTGFATVSISASLQSTIWVPTSGTNEPNGLTPWTNPGNVTNTAGAAATATITGFTNGLGATGGNPSLPVGSLITGIKITFAASGANSIVSIQIGGGGFQTINPTATLSTYSLGNSAYLWGYSSLTQAQLSNLTVTLQAESLGGSTTVSLSSLNVTVYYQNAADSASDPLLCTEYDFDVSNTSNIVSLTALVNGSATGANTLTAQLTNAGLPIGVPQVLTLPSATGVITFPSNWGLTLTPEITNSTSFGVGLIANVEGTASVNDVQLKINIATQQVDFNYLKTGEYQLGGNGSTDIQTLAFDSQGNLWNDPDFSGSLVLLRQNLAKNAFAKSVSQDDREYICISDLLTGADLPYQYVPNANPAQSYLDRVSQVGPGAAPLFTTNSTNSSSVISSITAWSITSNVATFTAANTFTAGEVVGILMASTSALNGTYQVSATGLSGTAFEVSLIHANASATESGTATPQYTYGITSITQPAIQTAGFACVLWSSGPGSTSTGNVVTFYYRDAVQNPIGDLSLINAVNSGTAPVYVFISGCIIGNGTQQVTSVGVGKAPGGQDNQYYFTIQADSSNYEKFGVSSHVNGNYQQTVATVTTSSPVPNLTVSNQVLLSGVTPGGWNAEYNITGVLNGSTMSITATSVSGGTATFDYALTGTSTAPPVVGEYVNVTGTLGGNGSLNGAGQVIASVTGATTGTFTIVGYSIPDFASTPEQSAQATTYGTQFNIDPGPAAVTTTNSPIIGAGTGGQLTIIGGTTVVVGAGTRQGTVFFETRTGFQTAPAFGVTFTTPTNTNYIYASNIPIGPPNVIARWIAFTEAGQNNVAGGSFYTIPTPVQYTVNGVTYTASALVINDNITTTAKFTFTDNVLLAATQIDVQGADLFNQIELGNPAWNAAYAGRMFYGLCNTKIQNFNNLSFDGGYLANPGGNTLPLGWSIQADASTGTAATITAFSITSNVVTFTAANTLAPGQTVYIAGLSTGTYLNGLQFTVVSATGTAFTVNFTHGNVSSTSDSGTATPVNLGSTLTESAVFGSSYLIQNTTAITQPSLGMIYQSAYQDQYNQNILQLNTLYSLRVTVRSNTQIGALIVDLTDMVQSSTSGTQQATFGTTYATYTLPCNEMTSSFATYSGIIDFSGNLEQTGFTGNTPVPTTLQLRLFAESLNNQGTIEVDRLEIFPTQTPIDKTNVYVSYEQNLEAFDGVTGKIGLNLNNSQQPNGAVALYDLLYFLKDQSIFVTQDSEGTEPDQWDIKQVSAKAGTIGPNSFDSGENYIITACRPGVFVFTGNQPEKVSWEIQQLWETINWSAGRSIWVRNDTTNRRFYVGVPLPTPNFWLPTAPVNATPTSPNVVLMCNYQAVGTGPQLAEASGLSETMFGTTKSNDMRRKWSIWQITSPYGDFLVQKDGVSEILNFGNGVESSQILALTPSATNDAGTAINSRYTTYGFVDSAKQQTNPLLGFHQKRFTYLQTLVTGSGICDVMFYPNTLAVQSPNYTYSIPGGLNLGNNPGGNQDFEKPLNVRCQRVFVEFATDALDENFSLSKLILVGSKDVLPVRGNLI